MFHFASLKRTSAPEDPVVDTATAKAHLRVAHSSEDTIIGLYVATATAYIEDATCRALIEQEWTMTLDAFPGCAYARTNGFNPLLPATFPAPGRDAIVLPRPPLLEVSEITYIDANGDEKTLDESEYVVDSASEPARVTPAYGSTWPTTRAQPNSVSIVYTAGYSGDPPPIPEALTHAVLLMTGHLYENREATTSTPLTDLPMAIDALIAPHRVVQL